VKHRWLAGLVALSACGHPATTDRDGAPEEESPAADSGRADTTKDPAARDASPDRAPAPDALPGADTATAPSPDAALPPGQPVAPRTVVLDGATLAQTKQKLLAGDAQLAAALARVKMLADTALTAGPWSVMDKTTTPPSGNKHDYLSLARYYWPSASANGCPYTRKDGQTNPETSGNKYDHASRHAAMDAIHDLAVTWYFTGEARYAERAALVARTWFLSAATAMNPNVNFGEGVPCLRDGTDTGVLNWTELLGETLDGIAILDTGAPGWSAADQMALRTWMTALLGWMQTSALGKEEGRATNNHGTWYDVGVSQLMLYLGQGDAARTLLQAGTKRIAAQIQNDGSQPEELARTNTWGYANWNLEGFCLLAHTASHVEVDLWNYTAPGGGSIAKAADYLIDGAVKGKSAWVHPQILPFEPSWPLSVFHAVAEHAGDARAGAAIPMVPVPPEGDLWPLLPVCTSPAIQPR
jgi:hypothetical protein